MIVLERDSTPDSDSDSGNVSGNGGRGMVLPSAIDGHSSWQLAFCVANVYLSPEFFPLLPILSSRSSCSSWLFWSSWSSVIAAEVQLHKLLNTKLTVESQCIELCCPFSVRPYFWPSTASVSNANVKCHRNPITAIGYKQNVFDCRFGLGHE